MLTTSALYRRALPFPHRRESLVQVWHGDELVTDSDRGGITIVAGSVSATLASRVTRTLDLTVQPGMYPRSPDDVLSPYVAQLRVFTGIGYPDGTREMFPVFTGRVETVSEDAAGTVKVTGSDLAADIIDAQFEQPVTSRAGSSVTSEIHRLITQVIPHAVFGADDVDDAIVPALVWDTDRGQALDDLSDALAARWYALGDGSFVTRRYPYTLGAPVVTIRDGAAGTNLGATRTITRAGVYNSVTIQSERMDGTDPVSVTIRDNRTNSPTRYGGPFGIVTDIVKTQTPLDASQAQVVGNQQLAASTALAEQWTVNCVPDASLEPGDTAAVQSRNAGAIQVLDSITYPLTTDQTMQLSTRASVPVPVVGVAG